MRGVLGALVFVLVGCGPIEYVNQVTRKADSAVEAARAVEADKYAPYYYTLALEYLHKAREEASYADYQAANRFGRAAAKAAIKAKELSLARASDPDNTDGPIDLDESELDGDGDMAPLVDDDDDDPEMAPLDDDDDVGDDDEVPGELGGDE